MLKIFCFIVVVLLVIVIVSSIIIRNIVLHISCDLRDSLLWMENRLLYIFVIFGITVIMRPSLKYVFRKKAFIPVFYSFLSFEALGRNL